MEAPKPVETASRRVDSHRSHRVPGRATRTQDTLKALIASKAGDIYSEEVLRRDYMALWNTGRFDDIRLETEPDASA